LNNQTGHPLKIIFLGSSGAIQVPSFHCLCTVCEAARRDPQQRRTRASLGLLGRETTLIDASPDLEFQLERQMIRRVDRIFITHWHFDHIAGLAALAEPSSHALGPPENIDTPGALDYRVVAALAEPSSHALGPPANIDNPRALDYRIFNGGFSGVGNRESHVVLYREPDPLNPWPPIDIYVPRPVMHHFDQELAFMRSRINLHPIEPGDRLPLPDATWEVVKTDHNEESVGFIIEANQRFAYLVDGITPPPPTMRRLTDLDFVILEATMDELDEKWKNFSLEEAVACWKQIGAERCILTHLSCHGWKDHRLIAGFSHEQRMAYEAHTPGLTFAYDGMSFVL